MVDMAGSQEPSTSGSPEGVGMAGAQAVDSTAPWAVDRQLEVKVLVDKQKRRVVFMEAGKDVADSIFSILAWPLGKFMSYSLQDHESPAVGRLHELLDSVIQLEGMGYLQTPACCHMLVDPKRAHEFQYASLPVDMAWHDPRVIYVCPSTYAHRHHSFYSTQTFTWCPCGSAMNNLLVWDDKPEDNNGEGGVFVKGAPTFLVTDDLCILPMSLSNIAALLDRLGIKDRSVLEERTLSFGRLELLKLVWHCLVCVVPLSAVFLWDETLAKVAAQKKRDRLTVEECKKTAEVNQELMPFYEYLVEATLAGRQGRIAERKLLPRKRFLSLRRLARAVGSKLRSLGGSSCLRSGQDSQSKRVRVNLIRSKVKNEVVFVEAGKDFIDILCSFLTLPFGALVKLLGKDCPFSGINNLYTSVEDLSYNAHELVKSEECKLKLLSPGIAAHSGISKQVLRIEEVPPPKVALPGCHICYTGYVTVSSQQCSKCVHGVDAVLLEALNPKLPNPSSKRGGGFVKWEGKFIVTNDMEVIPLSPGSAIRVFNELKGSVKDYEEREINIGEREVLKLLAACLRSRTPLTDTFLAFDGQSSIR